MKLVITLLLLSGCGFFKKEHQPLPSTEPTKPTIIQTANLYCELGKERYELSRYVHSKCDGSGFTSLYSLFCRWVDLGVFEENGKLFRSPQHDCFNAKTGKSNGSSSECSRDMYLMRLVAAFEHKDVSYLDRTIAFGIKNNWIMCTGKDLEGKSRCIFTPGLKSLFYAARDKLNGKKVTPLKIQEIGDLPLLKGYQAHLEMIKLWLSGKIYGGISSYQLNRMRKYSEREDRNALFSAIYHRYLDGDFTKAIELLSFFPKDRLPGSQDYCTEYIWQRDQDTHSWKPCNEGLTHSGTDHNFVVYIINN